MDLDKTVRRATKVLGECVSRDEIVLAVADIAFLRNAEKGWAKKGKAAAKRLHDALRRVQLALKSEDLFPLLKNHAQYGYLSQEQLAKWLKHCDAIAQGLEDPNNPLDESRQWRGAAEKCAAEHAYKLLRKCNRHIATTKKTSEFAKLAAVLSGNPKADFHHYCRAVLAAPPKDEDRAIDNE